MRLYQCWKGVIPFVVYKDVLVYETVFFLFEAKSTGLAALGRGFLTKKKGKTGVKYTSLDSINGIKQISKLQN